MKAEPFRPSPEVLAKVRETGERELSIEEIQAVLSTPVEEEERAEILALVAWFRRRYPTPKDRLAYVRRAYRRWRRGFEATDSRRSPGW